MTTPTCKTCGCEMENANPTTKYCWQCRPSRSSNADDLPELPDGTIDERIVAMREWMKKKAVGGRVRREKTENEQLYREAITCHIETTTRWTPADY